jgi:hypothetical protein
METIAPKNKNHREVNPRPFLPGEKAMIARTHKKMLAARAKKEAEKSRKN